MNDPRLNIGLQTKLTQKLLITPQMKQSLSLLQMPITELVQEISTYLEENPILETSDSEIASEYGEDSSYDAETSEGESIEQSLLEDMRTPEWDNYIEDSGTSNELSYTPLTSEDELANYEQYVSSDMTLNECLLFQLKTAGLTDKEVLIGEEIIGNLSEDGYFRYDLSQIAETCSAPIKEVKKVLGIVKTFEPAGVASESMQECIIRQLPDIGASEGEILQIKELLENYSKELMSYKYEEIEKKTGLDRESLNDLLDLIKRTDPKPGLNFSGGNNNFIYPDIYIIRKGDEFDVLLNETGIPPLKLNNYYIRALRDGSLSGDTKEYVEDKLKSAIWVLKSLQKRQKAIYRVAKAIVDIQKEYLLKGEAYLKPLILKDIADITDLHESTVSRVTAGKYALSDQGLIELKSFFSKGIDSQDGDLSTRSIKHAIKDLIDGESSDSVYSDDKIVKLLSEQGINIARRTVAKYRDELGIPTMSQRKRMRR